MIIFTIPMHEKDYENGVSGTKELDGGENGYSFTISFGINF